MSSGIPESVSALATALNTSKISVIIVARHYAHGLSLLDEIYHASGLTSDKVNIVQTVGTSMQHVIFPHGSTLRLAFPDDLRAELVQRMKADLVLLDATSLATDKYPRDFLDALKLLTLPGGKILTYEGKRLREMDSTIFAQFLTKTREATVKFGTKPADSYLTSAGSFFASSMPAGSVSVTLPTPSTPDLEYIKTLESKVKQYYDYEDAEADDRQKTEALVDVASTIIEQLEKMQVRSPQKSELESIRRKIDGLSEFMQDLPEDFSRKKELEDLIMVAEDLFHQLPKKRGV